MKNTELLKIALKFIILSIICVAIPTFSVFGLYKLDRHRFRECLNNPPSKNYIEETLECVFMTTGVIVYDYDQQDEYLYVKVEANNLTYKVEYTIERLWLCSFGWKYNRYIEIREED